MNNLQDYLEGYLALRQALGYKLRTHRSSLNDFVQFASKEKAATITTTLALAWAMKPSGANPKWWVRIPVQPDHGFRRKLTIDSTGK